jgi:hypothetical protein
VQALECLLLAVLRVADEHVVAFASRRILDAFENEREERIGDVGNRDDHLAEGNEVRDRKVVSRLGIEPRTRRLRVCCSAN